MVLFNEVVQAFYLPDDGVLLNLRFILSLLECWWIRRVFLNGNHAR
jgi:hypothetical protein